MTLRLLRSAKSLLPTTILILIRRLISMKYHNELRCDQNGSIMVLWAITLTATVAMIGLGVETGNWYMAKRNLQSAADAASIAGAYENSSSTRTASVITEMSRNGFSSSNGVSVTVNNPPLSGSYSGNSNAVEVIVSQSQQKMFSAVLMDQVPIITVRSVAIRNAAGTACVLALNSISADTLLTNGSAVLNMPNCMLAANSTNNGAISINGNSSVNAYGLYTPGGYSVNGSATLTTATTPVTDGNPLVDPYSSLTMPSFSGCHHSEYSTNNTVILNPGVFCKGFKANANAKITLNPGTYIIDRGTFEINGQAELTGTDVTIILTSSTGSDYAKVTINGGAKINLSASTTGTYKGLAFYQDKHASTNNDNHFNGGSTMNINGALYFPKGHTVFNGGSSITSPCTQIVAYSLTFNGNNNITNNCPASSVTPITIPGSVTLEE